MTTDTAVSTPDLAGDSLAREARELMETGAVAGGMVPKLTTMVEALEGGVGAAVVLSGVEESALLLELFTEHGVGTLITR